MAPLAAQMVAVCPLAAPPLPWHTLTQVHGTVVWEPHAKNSRAGGPLIAVDDTMRLMEGTDVRRLQNGMTCKCAGRRVHVHSIPQRASGAALTEGNTACRRGAAGEPSHLPGCGQRGVPRGHGLCGRAPLRAPAHFCHCAWPLPRLLRSQVRSLAATSPHSHPAFPQLLLSFPSQIFSRYHT